MPSIREALSSAAERFTASDSAQLDAQLLLCQVLQCNTAHLYTWPDKAIEPEQAERFEELVLRREQGEPIAYIRGVQEFYSREFIVNPHTLIPRPETECMIEQVLEHLDAERPLKVIDLGTGTGAIAVTLACERPAWSVSASDLSAHTLAVARDNAERLGAHVSFFEQDWLSGDDRYDLIISNPPYIRCDDPHLQQGDVRFEPRLALASGTDGMVAIRAIISSASQHLEPGGYLALEHGYDQQALVADTLRQHGLTIAEQGTDHAGLPRFITATAAL